MPNILDVFTGDAYSMVSMTKAINKAPFAPGRLASLFAFEGISTLTVAAEEKAGLISLIPAKTRNSGQTTKRTAEKRKVRNLSVIHLPCDDAVEADDVQGVRKFDSADQLETVDEKVNEKLMSLRQDHEVTHEYHRISALQGKIYDADGTTELLNLYTEFGLTRETIDFELADPATKVKKKCSDVVRIIQAKLGGLLFNRVACQCGDDFWDMLVNHDEVKKAYERAAENNFAREDQRLTGGFTFCGIYFENYRGKVGDVDFVPADEACFYPEGVPELFKHYGAPANWSDTVNTIGIPVYAQQIPRLNKSGIDIESQSNPLIICRRPETLVGGITDVIEL